MTRTLKIAFMGTPDFAVPSLQALIDGPDTVVGVFTNPDRPAGRGKASTPSPVKVAAEAASIPVFQPRSARGPEFAEALASLDPDLAVVVAYGRILPQAVLDIPHLGCVNVHASVLPRLRGAAPINWAIVRGEQEVGVSIMRMEAGLDSGPVFHIARADLHPGETAGELHDRLMTLGAAALMTVLDDLRRGEAVAVEQDHALMTYAPMMTKADGQIDWSEPAEAIVRRILGFNPWPGAATTITRCDNPRLVGTPLKIHRASRWPGDPPEGAAPGTVLSQGADEGTLLVAAGQGVVEITQCQAPGKRALDALTFLRGSPLPRGTLLGGST